MVVFRWLVCSFLLLGPAMAHAQDGAVTAAVEASSSGVGTGTFSGAPTTGQPFITVRKTTSVHKLADGTTITRISTTKEARDSQGRTVNEMQFSLNGVASEIGLTHTFVFDPVEHTSISWNNRQKQATRFHLPDAAQVAAQRAKVIAAAKTAREANPAPATETDSSLRPRTKREQLGGKNIAGVYAEGTRTTMTYPVGSLGNDKPIVVVHENWTSPDLKLIVMQTNDDPRTGSSTTETTELERSEPDPALFQVPEGYTIKDIHPHYPD